MQQDAVLQMQLHFVQKLQKKKGIGDVCKASCLMLQRFPLHKNMHIPFKLEKKQIYVVVLIWFHSKNSI